MGIINRVLGTARRASATTGTSTARTRGTTRRGRTAAPATTTRGGGLLSGLLRRKGL
jgi:hypothetical protein